MAQDIGPEACWLLTIIAHQEDAKRYRGPVTFWNEQLMPLCGFGGRSRLVAARVKAVEAGWLHYEGGGKGRPGVYWALIPAGLDDLEDTPCDETPDDICRPESGQQTDGNGECRPKSGRNSGRQPDGNRTANLHHSSLTLNPIPKKRACFVEPTVEEVRAYCHERGNAVDPQRFIDHYTANGWRVGKNPMRDWKAAIRTWEKNGVDNHARNGHSNGSPRRHAPDPIIEL
ncbi:MAG: hypothetical protein KJZ87_19165 [Thermoguttaceae bacterium]|nr:hypothetical protein [Thermoguttaceae bacterium]